MSVLQAAAARVILGIPWSWSQVCELVAVVTTEYEKSIPTARLRELLSERDAGIEIVPTSSMVERAELRPCANPECGCPIQPGQAYVLTDVGPTHVGCGLTGYRT